MVGEKGLEPSIADRIGEYVKLKGGMDLVKQLTADGALIRNKSAKAALEDMKLLLHYVELFGIKEKVGEQGEDPVLFQTGLLHIKIRIRIFLATFVAFTVWC